VGTKSSAVPRTLHCFRLLACECLPRYLTGCHRACRVGCSRPNDIYSCTTRFYASRYWNCDRCKVNDNYRSLNNPWHEGCEKGALRDKECKAKYGPKRLLDSSLNETEVDEYARDLEEVADATVENVEEAADTTQ
jgi:hypothetical protein